MLTLPVPTPGRQTIFSEYETALSFRRDILKAVENNDLRLDFSGIEWIETAELTPLACLINDLRNQGHRIEIFPPEDSWVKTWFEQIEFPEGTTNPPQWRLGNQLPLFRIDSSANPDIDTASDQIRTLLQKQLDGPIDPVMYPVQEILDNVNEHSRSDTAFVMVQNYPNKECIDICVTDNGISIPGNYDEYGHPYSDEGEAVRMALEEGVSTKGPQRGYGLRTTAKLVCEGLGGEVILSSKNGMVFKKETDMAVGEREFWDGTTFIARLYPPDSGFNIYDYVE